MGKLNNEFFDDTLPMGEVGQLGTSIDGPTAETALVIRLVAKQAIYFNHFCNMFYAGLLQPDRFDIGGIKVLNNLLNKSFSPAEKKGNEYFNLGVWAPLGPTGNSIYTFSKGGTKVFNDASNQYYDFSRLGGHDTPQAGITSANLERRRILMAYAFDNGENSDTEDAEFGKNTFLAQRDILSHIAREIGVDPKCWDMPSRKRIYDQLYNLQLGKLSKCDPKQNLQYICGRSLKDINNSIKDFIKQNNIDNIMVAEGVVGAGANANLHLFVNVRVNINVPGIQDILLRIRYPIYLRVTEKIGGKEVLPLGATPDETEQWEEFTTPGYYTGNAAWVVPLGVKRVLVYVYAAAGGAVVTPLSSNMDADGGAMENPYGYYVYAHINVVPGERWEFLIGSQGVEVGNFYSGYGGDAQIWDGVSGAAAAGGNNGPSGGGGSFFQRTDINGDKHGLYAQGGEPQNKRRGR